MYKIGNLETKYNQIYVRVKKSKNVMLKL